MKFLEYVIDFEVIVGEGVKVNVNGCIIYIGNVCMVNCLGWDKGIGWIYDWNVVCCYIY